jgi:hypothetical protein
MLSITLTLNVLVYQMSSSYKKLSPRVGKFHYCYSPLSKPYVRFSTHTAWAPPCRHITFHRSRSAVKVLVNPVFFLLSPFFTYCRDLHCTCKSLSVIFVFSPPIARYCFVSTTVPIGSVQNPELGNLCQLRDRWSISIPGSVVYSSMTRIPGDQALITKSAGFHLRLYLLSISAPALVAYSLKPLLYLFIEMWYKPSNLGYY